MTATARRVELTLDAPGERIDRALAEAMPEFSRMQWQRLIDDGRVTIGGVPVKSSLRLRGGENVEAHIPEVVEPGVEAESIPLDVRYEDADVVVVNKPAGMVVHPSLGHEGGTLVNALLSHCPDLVGVGGERRPGIVHRLDKDTSGLIIAAKSDQALLKLQAQFQDRTVQKVYLALVHGRLNPPEALIDAPIGRDPRSRQKMAVITDMQEGPDARPSQTRFRALHYYDGYTLVECRPKTGRKHQIRVHLAYIGFPIAGDALYGRRKDRSGLERQFLHARQLVFRRPSDDAVITVEAELPPDLEAVLAGLGAATE